MMTGISWSEPGKLKPPKPEPGKLKPHKLEPGEPKPEPPELEPGNNQRKLEKSLCAGSTAAG